MSHKKKDIVYPQQFPLQCKQMQQEDEVSLIDLLIFMRRYKKHFTLVFLFFFLVAFVYTYFIYAETYLLVTTMQIGTREVENTILPIEPPESLLSKINNSIIPTHTNDWVQKNAFNNLLVTTASNPMNTNIILIENKASEKYIDLISDFQKGLVAIVKDDHNHMVNALKSRLQSELILEELELNKLKESLTLERKLKISQIKLDGEEIKLKKLQDERYFGIKKAEFQSGILREKHEQKRIADTVEGYKKQIERTEENKKILLDNINDLKALIADASKNRAIAAASATEQSAMSQLLIGNEIQQNQNRLSILEERYFIILENKKAELGQKIDALRLQIIESQKKLDLLEEKYQSMLVDYQFQRQQQQLVVDEARMGLEQIKMQHENAITEQEEKIREIKTRLDNFNETRIVSAAVPSLRPTSISRVKLMLFSFVFAAFAGFVVMLFALFRDTVKERLKDLAEKESGSCSKELLS